MNNQRRHAIILGGSIAGLLAARVLSAHFDAVTIIERDALPSGPEPRKGAPQSRQLHGFLAGGVAALEELLPGFIHGARARGAMHLDVGRIGFFTFGGVPLPSYDSGLRGLLLSRPLLEALVRERVLALGNVSLIERHAAKGLLGDARQVTGVRAAPVDGSTAEEARLADLVIDATGRGSRTPAWLAELGLEKPSEQTVRTDMTITTCTIRRRPEHLEGKHGYVMGPVPPSRRSGAALAIEGDRYIIALSTYVGEPGPRSYEEMVAFARTLPFRGLYDLLRDAEPLSEPVQFHDLASRRRRYEKLERLPRSLLVMGDALCSFNPSYGQGVTVAALQAQSLDRWLAPGRTERAFFREASRLLDVPWSTVVNTDLQWQGVEGERTASIALSNAFLRRVMNAAGRDERVATALLRVVHLLAPPHTLFSPTVLASAWRHGSPHAFEPSWSETVSAAAGY